MTKNSTVEKIDQIINKIDANSSKELNEKEIRNFLNEIDDELVEVEDKAEGKQKEILLYQ